jgi:hypothetical protein
MSSRYDELERLQRLRESGALSDEEFQGEKRRILGYDAIEPAVSEPEPEPVEGREEAPSRLPLYLIIGGAVLIVAVALGLWLGNVVTGGGAGEGGNFVLPQENVAADSNLIQAAPAPDVRALPAEEQLARAFEAAFGSRGSAVLQPDGRGGEEIRYTPGRLVQAPFGPVLVSEGEIVDAPHVAAGRIAVHYLRPVGERFEVAAAFPAAVVAGSNGRVARWSVSPRFSDWPVIVAEGGGTWQGYSCTMLTLTELRPGGPAKLVDVPLSYDDSGAREDGANATSIDGRILNVVKNQSFDIVYSGSRVFSEHYVRAGNVYAVAGGKSKMETC